MTAHPGILLAVLLSAAPVTEYRAPAGVRPAIRRPGAPSILPGGRVLAPLGKQYSTGPGPFGLAISPSRKLVASADIGPRRCSLTVLERKGDHWTVEHFDPIAEEKGERRGWRSASMGAVFEDDRTLYVSEGDSGRVNAIDARNGHTRRTFDLNQGGYAGSYSGDLAFDRRRGLLYVADQANFRLAVIDVRKNRLASSVRVGRLPFAVALSPDASRVYVTNLGMFEYRAVSRPRRRRTARAAKPPAARLRCPA
jgi:phospholipase C